MWCNRDPNCTGVHFEANFNKKSSYGQKPDKNSLVVSSNLPRDNLTPCTRQPYTLHTHAMGKIIHADEENINYEQYEGADYSIMALNTVGGSGENEFNVAAGGTAGAENHFIAFGVDSLSDLVGKDMEPKEDIVFVDGVPDFDLKPKAGDALGPVFMCTGGGGFYLMNIKTKIPQTIHWTSQEDWEEPFEARRCE